MPMALNSDLDACVAEKVLSSLEVLRFDNQTRFRWIRVVSILRAQRHNLFPPGSDVQQLSFCSSIISIPALCDILSQLQDQGKCANSIHGHGKCITLRCPFSGENVFTPYEQLSMVAVCVDKNRSENGTEFLYIS